MKHRDAVRHQRRGSRARRERIRKRRFIQGWPRFEFHYPAAPYVQTESGAVYWRTTTPDGQEVHYLAPAPPSGPPPAEPFEWPEGWKSMGWTEDSPAEMFGRRGRSADYVVVDEIHHWLTHTEGGAIDGPRGRVDWVRTRKPGDA